MANNRKPRNKRGKLTRGHYRQLAPEAQMIRVEGEIMENPAYPGLRSILHQQTPKISPIGWGYEGQQI